MPLPVSYRMSGLRRLLACAALAAAAVGGSRAAAQSLPEAKPALPDVLPAQTPSEALPKPALPDPAQFALPEPARDPSREAPGDRKRGGGRPDAQVLLSQLYPDLAAVAARPVLPPATSSYTITPRAQAPAGEVRMAGAATPALPGVRMADAPSPEGTPAATAGPLPPVQLALTLGNGYSVPLVEGGALVAAPDDPGIAAMLASSPVLKVKKTPVAVNLPEPVHVNKADAETLARELKIDARRARFIIEFRQAYGSFKSPEDLAQVYGITDAMLQDWEDRGRIALD
jgi:competence protein ComEA